MPRQSPNDVPLVVDLCPYWCNPPAGGGPMRVHHLNKVVSEFTPVYHLSFRPTLSAGGIALVADWLFPRSDRITPTYTEQRVLDPVTLATSYALYKARLPHDLLLSMTASLAVPTAVIAKAFSSWGGQVIIQVEHPWLFRYAMSLARRLRAPVVFVAHNVESSLLKGFVRQPAGFARLLERWVRDLEMEAWTRADAVVTVSEDERLVFDGRVPRDPSTVSVIPNGVDACVIKPVGESDKRLARQRLGLPQDHRLILFVGSDHSPNREAVRLISVMAASEAFPQECRFLVVGTVSKYVKGSSKIIVRGFVQEVAPYLAASDIAVCPLLSGAGTSVKTVEYMAAGLAVVSTDIGVRGLTVRDGVHVLVRPATDILSGLRGVLGDPRLRHRLATNARKLVEQGYDWAALATRMVGVYQRLG